MNAELFYCSYGCKILFDRHLFVKNLETLLYTGLDAHVNEKEASIAEPGEEFGLNIFAAAANFPHGRMRKSGTVQTVNKFVNPAAAGIAPERKIIVLK